MNLDKILADAKSAPPKVMLEEYRDQFVTPVDEIEQEIQETTEQFEQECVGDVPDVDLYEYEHAKAIAIAMAMKYNYAA